MGKLRRTILPILTDVTAAHRHAPAPLLPTFADLLRQYRAARGYTQEVLAERSTLSVRALNYLEHGVKTRPQKATVRLLVEALSLSPEERIAFEEAARNHLPPGTSSAAVAAITPVITPPSNLPPALSPLIGRAQEIATAATILVQQESRLVTLTGPGGVGKTRLALAIAAAHCGAFPNGVFLIPLAAARTTDAMISAVAQAMGLQETAQQSLLDVLRAFVAPKRLLLLLDNCEQIADGAQIVEALLTAGPTITLLCTSRGALHLRGERELPVAPLALPVHGEPYDVPKLAAVPSVALFVRTATAIKPDFALTESNAAVIAAICMRLDGLPLAIELAAARIRLLPPVALRTRLERRLPLLTSGARDLPARQQTLRDTIAWSYELLTAKEQQLFRYLAVFVSGCTLEAAETVCVACVPNVLDALDALIDQGLVGSETISDASVRLIMLETIREYGLEQLEAHGDQEAFGSHAAYFLAFVETAEVSLVGPDQAEWCARLDAESDNLQAALTWLSDAGETAMGLQFAGALWRYWFIRGRLTQGRAWLDRFLDDVSESMRVVHRAAWAKALYGAGVLGTEQGAYTEVTALIERALPDLEAAGEPQALARLFSILGSIARYQGAYATAMARYAESLRLYRALNSPPSVAMTLNNLATVADVQGDSAQAMVLYMESLAIKRSLGDRRGIGVTLHNMADCARNLGDYPQAIAFLEESLGLLRALDDKPGMAYALNNLGDVMRDQHNGARATALYQESLALFRELGDQGSIALSAKNLGDTARLAGDDTIAAAYYEAGLAGYRTVGNRLGETQCREGLAYIAVAHGEMENATRLLGHTARVREELGTPIRPVDRLLHDAVLAAARTALGDAAFHAAWDAGHIVASVDDSAALDS